MKKQSILLTLLSAALVSHLSAATPNKQATRVPTQIEDYVQGQITGGFPGVEDLFIKLGHVKTAMASSKSEYLRQQALFEGFDVEYEQRAALRETTFACVIENYQKLQAALVACQENKAKVIIDLDLDHRILQGQIEDLRACTSKEIAILQHRVDLLTEDIREIKEDYATVSQLSKDNVDKAVVELESIRTNYRELAEIRTTFLSHLDTLLDALKSAESVEKDDTINLKSTICDAE